MKNALRLILFLLAVANFFPGGSLSAQEKNYLNKIDSSKRPVASQVILKQLESAISQGDVSALSSYFGSQVYLSLSNGIRGYYSSNQAYYVLEDFFRIYNVTSFRFDNINPDENNPYATGVYNFEFKGKRNSAQVYISIKKTGSSWKITQITIN
jgi:hypothetical protein